MPLPDTLSEEVSVMSDKLDGAPPFVVMSTELPPAMYTKVSAWMPSSPAATFTSASCRYTNPPAEYENSGASSASS